MGLHKARLCGADWVVLPKAAGRYSRLDFDGTYANNSAAYKREYLHPFTFTLDVPAHLVPEKLKRQAGK